MKNKRLPLSPFQLIVSRNGVSKGRILSGGRPISLKGLSPNPPKLMQMKPKQSTPLYQYKKPVLVPHSVLRSTQEETKERTRKTRELIEENKNTFGRKQLIFKKVDL